MSVQKHINECANRFGNELLAVDPFTISTIPYCRNYLLHIINHRAYYLRIYSMVLSKVAEYSRKPIQDISLLEVGAGNGVLGIFASYCGFGNVYINDADQRFTSAASALSKKMNIPVTDCFTADASLLKQWRVKPDAVIGTDVIEHIYDLEDFFETICTLNSAIVPVFTTASNPMNARIVERLRKLQIQDEYHGTIHQTGVHASDEPHHSYLSIRKEIIERQHILEATMIDDFAKRTRGLNEQDILLALAKYQSGKVLPVPLNDPCNTCHPITGSWTERILPIAVYRELYQKHGLDFFIFNGFYNSQKQGFRGMVNKTLNMALKLIGIRIAPFIVFAGSKK